jgi:hypothetical protein
MIAYRGCVTDEATYPAFIAYRDAVANVRFVHQAGASAYVTAIAYAGKLLKNDLTGQMRTFSDYTMRQDATPIPDLHRVAHLQLRIFLDPLEPCVFRVPHYDKRPH